MTFPTNQDLASRQSLVDWLKAGAPRLSVGLLAANAMAYGAAIEELEAAKVSLLHFDIMDRVFCPQMTAGAGLVKAAETAMLKDVHLMVADPLVHIDDIVRAGADIVHIHAEGMTHLHRALVALDRPVMRQEDRKVLRSVALNPGSSLELLRPVLTQLEMVTLLAVDPGWGGGTPDDVLCSKVKAVREMAREVGTDPLICIDGGINAQTYATAAAMNPDIIVSGSATFKPGQPVAANIAAMMA